MTAVRAVVVSAASLACAAPALAAVRHVPLESHVALKPGQAITVTVDATEPAEIGWTAVQPQPCADDCVQATDVSGGINYTVATKIGASMKYKPAGGRIVIEYKNVSKQPVAIDVYRIERTCESEACRYFDWQKKGTWLVFKVDEFRSIVTSTDESYSMISGVTTTGKAFTVRAVWWTDDRKSLLVTCAPSVKRYLDAHAPKTQYTPYIISGQSVGDAAHLILTSVDTCAAKAPHFGVPEKNVYK